MRWFFPSLLIVLVIFVVVTNPVFDLEATETPSNLNSATAVSGITSTATTLPTVLPTDTRTLATETFTPVPTLTSIPVSVELDTVDFVKILAHHRVKWKDLIGPVALCDSLPPLYPRLLLPRWVEEWDQYIANHNLSLSDGLYATGAYCFAPSVVSAYKYSYMLETDPTSAYYEYLYEGGQMCPVQECDASVLVLGPVDESIFEFGEWKQEKAGYFVGYSTNVPPHLALSMNLVSYIAEGTSPSERLINTYPAEFIAIFPGKLSILTGMGMKGSGYVFDN